MLDKDALNRTLEKALANAEQSVVQIKAAMGKVFCSPKLRGDIPHHIIAATTYADTSYHHSQKAFLMLMKRAENA